MLRIYRRHESWCEKASKADSTCKPKDKSNSRGQCPVWVTGTLQDGTEVKPKTLNTRNWQLASQTVLEMEAGIEPANPATTLKEAADSFVMSKGKKSPDRQRKLRGITNQLIAFATTERKTTVTAANDLPFL